MIIAQADIKRLPIADNSIDCIFTDPPYAKKFLHCYEYLAHESFRILKQGGFVIAMCGGSYLNKIHRMFDDAGLEYFYDMIHKSPNNAPLIWDRKVIAITKNFIVYSKGKSLPRTQVMNFYEHAEFDKRFHEWGQDIGSARYYIDCFTKLGDIICDPFIGGGTTAVACMALKRRFIGFDLEYSACKISDDRCNGVQSQNLHELPLFRKVE